MRKLIAVVAAVAVLLTSGLITGCGGGVDVGISGSHPLGTIAGYDTYFAGKKLKKEPGNEGWATQMFGGWAVEGQYETTLYKDAVPGYIHLVAIAHKDGKIHATAAKFRSGSLVFSKIGTKCESFAARMWTSLAGGEPEYKALFDPNLNQQEYFWATAKKGKVACTWRKDPQDQNMKNPRGVIDHVIFRAQ